jgi:selenocysteine lyase/cysteine desulfurase
MTAIHAYEIELNREMLAVLQSVPGARVYGITDPGQLDRRVPTFSITVDGFTPAQLAARLDEYNINTWDGNFYALEVTNRLGLEQQGGLLRIGATHYNTVDEIHHLGEVLREIVRG